MNAKDTDTRHVYGFNKWFAVLRGEEDAPSVALVRVHARSSLGSGGIISIRVTLDSQLRELSTLIYGLLCSSGD